MSDDARVWTEFRVTGEQATDYLRVKDWEGHPSTVEITQYCEGEEHKITVGLDVAERLADALRMHVMYVRREEEAEE